MVFLQCSLHMESMKQPFSQFCDSCFTEQCLNQRIYCSLNIFLFLKMLFPSPLFTLSIDNSRGEEEKEGNCILPPVMQRWGSSQLQADGARQSGCWASSIILANQLTKVYKQNTLLPEKEEEQSFYNNYVIGTTCSPVLTICFPSCDHRL